MEATFICRAVALGNIVNIDLIGPTLRGLRSLTVTALMMGVVLITPSLCAGIRKYGAKVLRSSALTMKVWEEVQRWCTVEWAVDS